MGEVVGVDPTAVVDRDGEREAQLPREGAEQRGEERYPVACDAEVYVPERTQMFRGTMTNISPLGCYVRTVAWVRLPVATAVEIAFTLNGRTVRARAEARFAQSRTGVGLRFLALEEETQLRLDGLIAGLRKAAAEAPLVLQPAALSSADSVGLEAATDSKPEPAAEPTSA